MSDWLRKMMLNPDENIRYTAVNCPVCWAYPGERCYRIIKGKKTQERRAVPHFPRISRYRRKLGGK